MGLGTLSQARGAVIPYQDAASGEPVTSAPPEETNQFLGLKGPVSAAFPRLRGSGVCSGAGFGHAHTLVFANKTTAGK